MKATVDTVGKSPRTKFKHELTDKMEGMFIGAACNLSRYGKDNVLMIDLCAGSGEPTAYSGTSSPQLMLKHLYWATDHSLIPVRGILIEKNAHTVALLRTNIPVGGNPPIDIHHGDYRSPEMAAVIDKAVTPSTVCFFNLDPNNVHAIELSPELRAALPEWTTMIVPMGCNAGGLMMLSAEIRAEWYARLIFLLKVMRPNHDAMLIRLERDSDKWAYLITVPTVWRRKVDGILARMERLEFWPKGFDPVWLKLERARFKSNLDILFKREDERRGI